MGYILSIVISTFYNVFLWNIGILTLLLLLPLLFSLFFSPLLIYKYIEVRKGRIVDDMNSRQQRQLNQGQIDVLMMLYKFRYGSRDLIASSLDKQNGTAMYSRLSILAKQGYVATRFEPSYKLSGRPAEYYLLPQALRALQELTEPDGLDDRAIKNSYKDKTASSQFISHCLSIYTIYNQLKSMYGSLQFFTKRELTAYDYFPKPLPDAFISLKLGSETRRYFLEVIEAETPPFVVDRRLRQLSDYYENDDWAVTEMPFPAIICICENGSTEKRFRKQVNRLLNRSDTDIPFYTTTKPALIGSSKGDNAIWSNTTEPEALRPLEALLVNP